MIRSSEPLCSPRTASSTISQRPARSGVRRATDSSAPSISAWAPSGRSAILQWKEAPAVWGVCPSRRAVSPWRTTRSPVAWTVSVGSSSFFSSTSSSSFSSSSFFSSSSSTEPAGGFPPSSTGPSLPPQAAIPRTRKTSTQRKNGICIFPPEVTHDRTGRPRSSMTGIAPNRPEGWFDGQPITRRGGPPIMDSGGPQARWAGRRAHAKAAGSEMLPMFHTVYGSRDSADPCDKKRPA